MTSIVQQYRQTRKRLGGEGGEQGEVYLGAVIGSVVAILVVVGLIFGIIALTSFNSTDGGHVAVVRNGGPLDNTRIRQVLPVNSGNTYTGLFSSIHNYPTSQRYFTIDSSGNGDSDESVTVPTADGVEVSIDAQVLFTLNTSTQGNYAVLKAFDNNYGTRSFRCSNGGTKAVYDGDAGFSCFLEQIVGPIITNDLRQSVGDLKCADLVASCSLVQNQSSQLDQSKVGLGNVNLRKIESDIDQSLQQDLNQTMHGDYINVDNFNLIKVILPTQLQQAITSAQTQFAQVSSAKAQQQVAITQANTRLQQAKIDAQANEAKQKGYNNCPTCASIDETKALPSGITVYAPGNSNVALPTK